MLKMVALRGRALFLIAAVALTYACEPPDAPRSTPATGGAPSLGDPGMLLRPDPVEQINQILGRSAYFVPGEPFQTRFRVRIEEPDTLAIDYAQRQAGEEWEITATGFAALGDLTVELSQARRIRFLCGDHANCFEYRAPEDDLPLGRLAEGPGRTRFLEALHRYAVDGPPGAAETEELNRTLRESAVFFSETVSSWYQVSFEGDWMRVVTWQYSEGFTEHTTPGVRLLRLAEIGDVNAAGDLACAQPGCVLFVQSTPITLVPPTTAQAARLAALLSGLMPGDPTEGQH